MPDLSVLIPARNEVFLAQTIADVVANLRGDTEVIAVCDGGWPDPPIADHPRVQLIYLPTPIGQRAATNLAARASAARYVMKLDAHCALAEGFDVELVRAGDELGPDVTQIPAMINLHAFNWRCRACGRETYQGPRPERCVEDVAHDRELAVMPPPCGEAQGFDQVLVWQPRRRRAQGNGSEGAGGLARTEFWRLDHNLEFQYRGPRVNGEPEDAEIADVMTSVGACFFMRRESYFEIGGLDEDHGGWGAFGCEIALKSWLSGGRHVVNRRTWFSHAFRTQGKDWGFPYRISSADQEYAKQYSRNMWFGNLWKGQVRPLSWLIDYFWPIRGWSNPEGAARLAFVRERGIAFTRSLSSARTALPSGTGLDAGLSTSADDQRLASATMPPDITGGTRGNDSAAPSTLPLTSTHRTDAPGSTREVCRQQGMSVGATGLGAISGGYSPRSREINSVRNQPQMDGITARGIITDEVVQLRDRTTLTARQGTNEPRIKQSGDPEVRCVSDGLSETTQTDLGVSSPVSTAAPDPATGAINCNVTEKPCDDGTVEMGNREKLSVSHAVPPLQVSGRSGPDDVSASSGPSILSQAPWKGLVYYSDLRIDPTIARAVQAQLRRAAPGLPIAVVTLQPTDFRGDVNLVLDLERGYLAMFRQILAGLEVLDTDVAFLVEHDILYHPSHFAFVPPRRDVFYYNRHTWKVDAETGRALHYRCDQTSGLCADRALLVEHYRRRVKVIEAEGYHRNFGFEPGTNRWSRALDPHGADHWFSPQPNIDIRHERNLTPSRWRQDQFRNRRTCQGWTESDEVPGWGRTRGRFAELLATILETPAAQGFIDDVASHGQEEEPSHV